MPVKSPLDSGSGPEHESKGPRVKRVQRAIPKGRAAGWPVGCSALGFSAEMTNKITLHAGWMADPGICPKLNWFC